MGKDIGFHIVSRKSGGDSKSENLDGFYDEPLATTGFTESYAPSLLLADFKV